MGREGCGALINVTLSGTSWCCLSVEGTPVRTQWGWRGGCWQGCGHLHCQHCCGWLRRPRGAEQVLPEPLGLPEPGQAAGGLPSPPPAGLPTGAPSVRQRKTRSVSRRSSAFLMPPPFPPPWTSGVTRGVGSHVGQRAGVAVTALRQGAVQGGTHRDRDTQGQGHACGRRGRERQHLWIAEWDIGCREGAQTSRAPPIPRGQPGGPVQPPG